MKAANSATLASQTLVGQLSYRDHSRLRSTLSKSDWTQKCAFCKSKIERQMIWNVLDILILHLPEDSEFQPRHSVAASEFVTIYMSKGQKTVYTLVISHLLQLSPTALSGISNHHICYNQSR